jgi:hypothetical protein
MPKFSTLADLCPKVFTFSPSYAKVIKLCSDYAKVFYSYQHMPQSSRLFPKLHQSYQNFPWLCYCYPIFSPYVTSPLFAKLLPIFLAFAPLLSPSYQLLGALMPQLSTFPKLMLKISDSPPIEPNLSHFPYLLPKVSTLAPIMPPLSNSFRSCQSYVLLPNLSYHFPTAFPFAKALMFFPSYAHVIQFFLTYVLLMKFSPSYTTRAVPPTPFLMTHEMFHSSCLISFLLLALAFSSNYEFFY